MKIVLTGFMGTGKTSVGRELSKALGYTFIDTDVLIEEREAMPISLIFKKKGEDYFRAVEQETVAEVSKMDDAVIATGGGVIKNRVNVKNLGRRGVIVWLRADPDIILRRVMLEGGKRPLLDVEEPLNEIKNLLSQRMSLYQQADVSIDTNYITPGEAAHEIMEKLGLDTEQVRVDLQDRSYDIVIGARLVDSLGLRVKEFRPSKVALISNKTIYPLYRDRMLRSFRECRIDPAVMLIPDGEEHKDFLWTYYLYGELLKAGFDRDSLLVAFGGGVVGDITGFVASTYMRGVRFIQVPTTLLAQVDSSVGGKTGVNHSLGKNMIGTFSQPSLVLVDVDTLRTLPVREFCAGMAEIIKYGVIADGRLFETLQVDREDILAHGDSLMKIIRRSCEIKADVVSQDEREAGLRAILNFGHTIGHAVETVTGYKRYLHGEAVAVGMAAAADVAVEMGMLKIHEAERIKELLEMYNLPCTVPDDLGADELLSAMRIDKKAKGGRLNFVLPESIGRVKLVEDVDKNLIRRVLKSV